MSRKQPDMTALARFLTEEISPKELGDLIDTLAFDYAAGVIARADELTPSRANADTLQWLKALRDVLWKTGPAPAK